MPDPFAQGGAMLKQYVPYRHPAAPRRQLGEVLLVNLGNYLEAGVSCRPKERPAIIVALGDCSHRIVGLTTKSHSRTSGEPRPEILTSDGMGLIGGRSYLWSPRPSFICRRDLRRHLGRIDRDTVMFLADHVNIDRLTLTALWQAVHARTISQQEAATCQDDRRPNEAPLASIVRRRPR